MGEVYKARDTRLDRIVALKVLPALTQANADLRQRFEREARAISSLTHPNICTLYDVGDENGAAYIVMEYLEGETLGDRIRKGALPVDELCVIGIQIADALDKAHKRGLVHRDLKPGNVMLTKNGAKLLDFGLAKFSLETGSPAGATAMTMTTPLTGEGTILGTLHYMSPEQLEGKEVDARSDLFSFGAILYEMATGKRPFNGSSQASIIASILKEQPAAVSQLQPLTPPLLERTISQCLAKDPDQRWTSAGDLRRALQWIADGGSQAGIPVQLSKARHTRERLLWAAIGTLTLVATMLAVLYLRVPRPVPQVARFMIETPPEFLNLDWPRLSPDGSKIAFLGTDSAGKISICIRDLRSTEVRKLVPVPNVDCRPFWSFDNKQLGYIKEKHLYRVDVITGISQLICKTESGFDGSWGAQNVIIFDGSRVDSINQVPVSGGTPTPATKKDKSLDEAFHGWPTFLPDGRHFLFLASDATSRRFRIKVGSIESLDAVTLCEADSRVDYANGYLMFERDNVLLAQPFDPDKLRLTGDPLTVSNQVASLGERSYFGIASNGSLIYQLSGRVQNQQIRECSVAGDSLSTPVTATRIADISLSPDGHTLAYCAQTETDGPDHLITRDLISGVVSKLTIDSCSAGWPAWSRNGEQIYYTNRCNASHWRGLRRAADGSGRAEIVLTDDSLDLSIMDESPDGQLLAVSVGYALPEDIWLYGTKDKSRRKFCVDPNAEVRASFSPDGRYLLYQENFPDGPKIMLKELAAAGGQWQVSPEDGRYPTWRSDGKEIYYVTLENQVTAVGIELTPTVKIGAPRVLFNQAIRSGGVGFFMPIVPSPDGKKFFLLPLAGEGARNSFMLVQNWAEELTQK